MDFLTKDFFARALIAKGRSTRKSYWLNVLVTQMTFSSVIMLASMLIFGEMTGLVIAYIYYIIIIIPGIMITIRRLHDTGRSGWHYLWSFTIIGILWVLFLLIEKGDEGANAHGDPSNIS